MDSRSFSDNSIHLARPQEEVKQNELRKMFLLNEPAYKKLRDQLENEKYLSDMDKSLKKVLYDKKIPAYKKWLIYRDILSRYLNYHKFLDESRAFEDKMSTEKLLQMERTINGLKSILNNKPTEIASTNDLIENVSQIKINTPEKHTPRERSFDKNKTIPENKLNTNKQNKRKSITPNASQEGPKSAKRKLVYSLNDEEIDAQPSTSKVVDITTLPAPSGIERIYNRSSDSSFANESSDFFETVNMTHVPMDMSFAQSDYSNGSELEDSGELHKIIDDKLISNLTPRQRLDAAPSSVQVKFLTTTGQYPSRIFRIAFTDPDEEDIVEESINGLDATIVDGNVLRVYTKDRGFVRFSDLSVDTLTNIRNYLVNFHMEINKIIEDFQNRGASVIKTRPYSIIKKDDNTQIIKYKNNAIASVQNEILDDVIDEIKDTNLTPEEFKQIIKLIKKQHQNKKEKMDIDKSFFDPLNRTSLEPTQKLSAISKTSSALSKLSASTPAKKRKANELTNPNFTLTKLRMPSKKPNIQGGSGIKWESI